MAVNITSKPTLGVYSLGAPVRYTSGSNTRLMKATWNLSDWTTDENNAARATGQRITWALDVSGVDASKDPTRVISLTNMSIRESVLNLTSFTIGNKAYNRSSFFPNTKKKLLSVSVSVVLTNAKGDGTVVCKQTRKFLTPKKPTISAPTFDTSNGRVSMTITADAGTGYREKYDTRYVMTVYDSRTGKTVTAHDGTFSGTTQTLTRDVSNYMALPYGGYVKIKLKAWSRGYAGISDKVTKEYYVSYPAKVNIKSVSIDSASSTGKVTASIDTNTETKHPVDRVILEYLPDVQYEKAKDIPASESWTVSNVVDNGKCTAMAIPVAEVMPSRGNHTWLRVKSWHASENVLYRYSNYVDITDLYTPAATASDDEIKIISATAGASGESIVVQLGWNADGQDDSTGTEISWATEEDAWKSTKSPEDYTFTWSDGELIDGQTTYNDSAIITIKGLNEGETYYIKARRYLDGDVTTYSPYSNPMTCKTSEEPDAVFANCLGLVADGEPLQVYWTFTGSGLQKEWKITSTEEAYAYEEVVGATGNPNAQGFYEIYNGNYRLTNDTSINTSKTYYSRQTYGSIIAKGEGSLGSTQIDAERLATFANDGVVTFKVEVSTGSGFVSSEPCSVAIANRPTLTVTAGSGFTSDTMTAQGASVSIQTSEPCDLMVVVTSHGASSQFPDGLKIQTSGDTIYSDVIIPTYTVSNNVFSATVTLPTDLDFWDLCEYELSVVAIDTSTSLKSEEVVYTFTVNWATKAKNPVVTVTPIDTTDASGVHHLAVDLALSAPTGSASSDVYDIYRMDCGKAYLIGRSFPRSITVRDEYAPYSDGDELYYRIALRTADGSVSFKDVSYTLESKVMRFDWADGVLELPYGLTITDSYSKDVEFRSHLDGSIDGYWRQNIERKSSLGTSVIKLIQPTEIEMARKLARYTGAVFVRLPNGTAYEADVQVSDMSVKNKAVTAISIDATEIGLTDEFSLPTPYTL